jgi:hypothetical protein
MDKGFKQVMIAITELAETTAEQAMEYSHNQKDDTAEANGQKMRDDFAALHDKMSVKDFDGVLTHNEYMQLTVAAYIATNQIKNRIATLRSAVKGYEDTIIPKLSRIVDECKTDEEAQKLAEEILIIEANE